MKSNILKTTESYLVEVRAKHGNLYDYSDVEYISAKDKIKVRCFVHGYFLQEASYFVNKSRGCPKCVRKSITNKSKMTTAEFIYKAVIIHKDKYDYSLVNYINSSTKVTIVCPVHGAFSQTPNNHLRDRGCNLCRFTKSVSKAESDLALFINDLMGEDSAITSSRHEWLDNKELDIYIPSLNIAIEYNGYIYHHSSKGVSTFLDNTYVDKNYHLNKYNLCKENGIDLIHIFEFEDIDKWKIILKNLIQTPSKYSIDFDNQFRHIELYNKNLNFYGISIISTLTDN